MTAPRPRGATALLAALAALAAAVAVHPPTAAAATTSAVTSRISVRSDGTQMANGDDVDDRTAIDGTGRYVAFSVGLPLQADDTNGTFDVYLRDRRASTTTRVSLTDGDAQIAGHSHLCGMSDDARFVGFWAKSASLPSGSGGEIFLRDRTLGTTTLVSQSTGGVAAGTASNGLISFEQPCPISDDGRFVAFASAATNLVAGDDNGVSDVFRRDRQSSVTLRVSQSSGGTLGDDESSFPDMSANGALVVFQSEATNLVGGDSNGVADVFLRLPSTSTTVRASLTAADAQLDLASQHPAISGDGSTIVFQTGSKFLDPSDTNNGGKIVARNRVTGASELVSRAPNGDPADADSIFPAVSDDGRYVTFCSGATNLYVADGNGKYDLYRRDRTLEKTDLLSRRNGSINSGSAFAGYRGSISDDGTVTSFVSAATNLVRNDTNASGWDVFVRELQATNAPFSSIDAFVKQQHVDFAGRTPSAAEATEWKAHLANGEHSADSAVVAFAHSTTWSAKRGPLVRLYWAFFLRTPDKSGLDYWVGKLNAGTSLSKVAKQFAASSEFQTKYGSKTNSQFVTLIYQNIFDRDPDPGGLAYWTGKLDSGAKTRGDVMVNFSESSEGKRVLAPQTDTVLVWLGMLGAMPPKASFDAAVAKQAAGGSPADLVDQIRTSGAYAARVTI